jgi:hypothetical protein
VPLPTERRPRLSPGPSQSQPDVDLPAWLSELLTSILDAPPAPALPSADRPEARRAS